MISTSISPAVALRTGISATNHEIGMAPNPVKREYRERERGGEGQRKKKKIAVFTVIFKFQCKMTMPQNPKLP